MAWVYESEMLALFNTSKSEREVPHARKYMHIVVWNSESVAWSLRDFASIQCSTLESAQDVSHDYGWEVRMNERTKLKFFRGDFSDTSGKPTCRRT